MCSTPELCVAFTVLARMSAWPLAPVRNPPFQTNPPLTVTEPCAVWMSPDVHVIAAVDQVAAPVMVCRPPFSCSVPAPPIEPPATWVVAPPSRRMAPPLIVDVPPIVLGPPLRMSVPASTSSVPVCVIALVCEVVPAPVLRIVPEFSVRTLKVVPASSRVPRLSNVPDPPTEAPASSKNVPWFWMIASVWGTPADIVEVAPAASTSAPPFWPMRNPPVHVNEVVTVRLAAVTSDPPPRLRAPTVCTAETVTSPPGMMAWSSPSGTTPHVQRAGLFQLSLKPVHVQSRAKAEVGPAIRVTAMKTMRRRQGMGHSCATRRGGFRTE